MAWRNAPGMSIVTTSLLSLASMVLVMNTSTINAVTQKCQNLTQLQLCNNSARVHSYVYVPHWKMLKHFIYVQYGCGKQSQWSTASSITKDCQNLTQLWQCNGVRKHSYAYVPHWRVEKYFIYVHYGCGKQSKVDYSLNNDVMASFPLDSHPELLNTNHSWFSGATV